MRGNKVVTLMSHKQENNKIKRKKCSLSVLQSIFT